MGARQMIRRQAGRAVAQVRRELLDDVFKGMPSCCRFTAEPREGLLVVRGPAHLLSLHKGPRR